MKQKRAIGMEFIGTMILAIAIVGSGHMAANLAQDGGVQLLINALATALSLAVVVKVGMKTSGAHFNPAVTFVMVILKKISNELAALYIAAQVLGAILGVGIANLIYDQSFLKQSTISRDGSNLFFSELFATAVLVLIILTFRKKDELIAIYVPIWIFGAILFTSSTSFANPAITIGRVFTNSFTGIALDSVLLFVVAQFIGALVGLIVAKNLTIAGKKSDE
ncbi:permease, glycerol uptake facilitator [Candidatus Nanopelagicus limnes]|uniref:Permease, glycerol uptake facilitator n=1 Tax=Candidatus Nanopelagicus limnae TaxID=1884634 RepID=A0A249JY85_9ACTN|nr:MIP/aquaporin family protein [Candidatus Nanopelagicus limnes]ASY09475.1 permease, glycerol uptake facilitator [Candidatus Nanopelagicus limnes]